MRHGESVSIDDLPAGIAFTIVEMDANQYGYTLSSSGASGVIRPGETVEAEFINRKTEEEDEPDLISITVRRFGTIILTPILYVYLFVDAHFGACVG